MQKEVSLKLAERIDHLGTETAFAVSTETQNLKEKKIYSFHVGDLNFSSPRIMRDALQKALEEGHTGYVNPRGIWELRQAISRHCIRERGVEYSPCDEICIQPGGKPVIFKFLQATMNPGDEVIVPFPGYPIYESLVRYLGGKAIPLQLLPVESKIDENSDYSWDWENLTSLISNKTRIFIWNDAHNPTGTLSSPEDRLEMVRLATKHNLWVLSDEAYFHVTYDQPLLKSIVSYPGMKKRTILLITISKSWACTGWRLGAAVGPKSIIDTFVKLSSNDESMTTNFVQWAAIPAFEGHCNDDMKMIKKELKKRRDLLFTLVNKIPGFSAVLPRATFYLWTDVTEAMKILQLNSYEKFRKQILHECKISFCTREHFGTILPNETKKYIRLAFSGIAREDIQMACDVLRTYMTEKS